MSLYQRMSLCWIWIDCSGEEKNTGERKVPDKETSTDKCMEAGSGKHMVGRWGSGYTRTFKTHTKCSQSLLGSVLSVEKIMAPFTK